MRWILYATTNLDGVYHTEKYLKRLVEYIMLTTEIEYKPLTIELLMRMLEG